MDNPKLTELARKGIAAMRMAQNEQTERNSKLSNIRKVLDEQISVLEETEQELKAMGNKKKGKSKKHEEEISVTIDDELITTKDGKTIEKIHVDINSKPDLKREKDKKKSSKKTKATNYLLESLMNAYMSDPVARQRGLESAKPKIKTLYKNLMEGSDYIHDFAIVIVHLYRPSFVGAHSYTFRREVIVRDVYDLTRLDNLMYTWPEVFNNKFLMGDKDKITKYKNFHISEVKKMEELLSAGKIVEPADEDQQICYQEDECGPKACKLKIKREIFMPEFEDGKVKGYCFDNDTLFDIILSSQNPINPYTKKPFSPHLVESVKKKYGDELLMRAYFRLTR